MNNINNMSNISEVDENHLPNIVENARNLKNSGGFSYETRDMINDEKYIKKIIKDIDNIDSIKEINVINGIKIAFEKEYYSLLRDLYNSRMRTDYCNMSIFADLNIKNLKENSINLKENSIKVEFFIRKIKSFIEEKDGKI